MSMTGRVVRLRSDKGFGFIKGEDGEDYFFHRSACGRDVFPTIAENDRVTFEPTDGPKGLRAELVELI